MDNMLIEEIESLQKVISNLRNELAEQKLAIDQVWALYHNAKNEGSAVNVLTERARLMVATNPGGLLHSGAWVNSTALLRSNTAWHRITRAIKLPASLPEHNTAVAMLNQLKVSWRKNPDSSGYQFKFNGVSK